MDLVNNNQFGSVQTYYNGLWSSANALDVAELEFDYVPNKKRLSSVLWILRLSSEQGITGKAIVKVSITVRVCKNLRHFVYTCLWNG